MLDGRSEQLPTSELAGGARIRHIFQDIFVEGVGELNPSRYLSHHHCNPRSTFHPNLCLRHQSEATCTHSMCKRLQAWAEVCQA